MKKLLLILAINFICFSITSQTEMNSVWINGFGGSGNEEASASVIDAAGNIYITGQIQNTLDIDPGPPFSTVSVNNTQAYFSKFSPSGVLIWSRNFDGEAAAESRATAISLDASGNVYVVGYFKNGKVDFDLTAPAINTITALNKDMFIAKYSSAGVVTWVKTIGATNANMLPNYAKVDGAGDLVIVGGFNNMMPSAVDFNPAGPAYTLATNGGPDDSFMAKYNSSGVMQWAFNIGSPMGEAFYGMEIDAANNIYVAGTFQSTIDVDPSSSTSYTFASNGTENMFFGKYNSSGGLVWGNAIGVKRRTSTTPD